MKNHSTHIVRAHILATISVLALLPGIAAAQSASDEDQGGVQDIVVTAQKKSENLQDVPISVTAIGGEALGAAQATTLQALQGTIPNVQIDNFSNTPQSAVFTIRGIGVIEPDPYAGNTVSIVVDGVPQFFSMGALLDLYDVDRIEVLRGPQGTLFGANTTGGVINVVTKQPTGDFGGTFKAVYGNYNRFDVTGSIEAPIIKDVLSAKIAAMVGWSMPPNSSGGSHRLIACTESPAG